MKTIYSNILELQTDLYKEEARADYDLKVKYQLLNILLVLANYNYTNDIIITCWGLTVTVSNGTYRLKRKGYVRSGNVKLSIPKDSELCLLLNNKDLQQQKYNQRYNGKTHILEDLYRIAENNGDDIIKRGSSTMVFKTKPFRGGSLYI